VATPAIPGGCGSWRNRSHREGVAIAQVDPTGTLLKNYCKTHFCYRSVVDGSKGKPRARAGCRVWARAALVVASDSVIDPLALLVSTAS
jgi:hypothetical protein